MEFWGGGVGFCWLFGVYIYIVGVERMDLHHKLVLGTLRFVFMFLWSLSLSLSSFYIISHSTEKKEIKKQKEITFVNFSVRSAEKKRRKKNFFFIHNNI